MALMGMQLRILQDIWAGLPFQLIEWNLILWTTPSPFMRERIGHLLAGIELTQLWNLWRCSQLISHLVLNLFQDESLVYYYGVYSSSHSWIKFRTGEGKRGEKTGVIRVSGYKRQKALAKQVPHGLAWSIVSLNQVQGRLLKSTHYDV